ncbi:MAG: SGNH/GDSL hydrolase family protein [Thermoguttaceae bacterium]
MHQRKPFTPILIACVAAALFVHATCAAASPLQIMPLGDSITAGHAASGNIPGGYREELYQRLSDAHYSVQLVGSSVDDPSAALTNAGQTHHEGHGSIRLDQINTNLDGNVASYNDDTGGWNGGYWLTGTTGYAGAHPEVILLLAGINDLAQGASATTAKTRLDTLIGHIYQIYQQQSRPAPAMIVANLTPLAGTPLSSWGTKENAFNALIPGVVTAHQNSGQPVYFLDMYSKLTAADLSSDGVHPNQSGYDKMGDAWFGALQSNGLLVAPEPSTLTLLACGLAGLLWYVRRKRRSIV